MKKALLVIFGLSLLITAYAMYSIKNDPKKLHAQSYTINHTDDYSYSNVKRVKWYITSNNAATKEQRAYTALVAAEDCILKTKAKECTVYQNAISNGHLWGSYYYSIGTMDNNFKFDVKVAENSLTQLGVNVAYSYVQERSRLNNMDAVQFEKLFLETVSKQTNIPVKQLSIPVIERKPFEID